MSHLGYLENQQKQLLHVSILGVVEFRVALMHSQCWVTDSKITSICKERNGAWIQYVPFPWSIPDHIIMPSACTGPIRGHMMLMFYSLSLERHNKRNDTHTLPSQLAQKKIKSNFKTTMHMKSNSYLMSSAWFFIWHAMWETSKPFSLLMHVSCGLLNSGIHFVICWGWIGFWHHILWMLIYRYAV